MLHFSCDFCGKDLSNSRGSHFIVKMEVYANHEPAELTEEDLDADHLDQLSQLLAEETLDQPKTPTFKQFRYDLCPVCHKKFLANPLGRENLKFDFSEN